MKHFDEGILGVLLISFMALVALMLLMLPACNTFNRIVTNNQLLTELAVEAATARVLHEHPGWQPKAVTITAGAIALIDASEAVTLDALQGYVTSRIDFTRLLPEERVLLMTLISQVRRNIEDAFRSQDVRDPGKQLVVVRQVLTWIHDTAVISKPGRHVSGGMEPWESWVKLIHDTE